MSESTRLELEEIAKAAYEVLDEVSIVSATLYVAHVYDGRPIKELAIQTGRDAASIEKRINYVIDRLQRNYQDQ